MINLDLILNTWLNCYIHKSGFISITIFRSLSHLHPWSRLRDLKCLAELRFPSDVSRCKIRLGSWRGRDKGHCSRQDFGNVSPVLGHVLKEIWTLGVEIPKGWTRSHVWVSEGATKLSTTWSSGWPWHTVKSKKAELSAAYHFQRFWKEWFYWILCMNTKRNKYVNKSEIMFKKSIHNHVKSAFLITSNGTYE